MAIHLTSKEISGKYDHFARWYDWVAGVPDILASAGFAGGCCSERRRQCWKLPSEQGKTFTTIRRIAASALWMLAGKC